MSKSEWDSWKSQVFFGKEVAYSVAGIVEDVNGKFLLVQTKDGKWGPPAGHAEEWEEFDLKSALFWEMLEETGIEPESYSLWGLMVVLAQHKLSIGYVYKVRKYRATPMANDSGYITDPNVIQHAFFAKEQIRAMLSHNEIRYAKWNVGLLTAWLVQKQFYFQLNSPAK